MIWRYRFTLFLFVGAFFLIISRLFYWQVVKAEELSSLGKTQYGQTVKIMPKRGEIRTSDGFSVATNKLSYIAFANPKEIEEKEKIKITTLLASFLKTENASISALLSKDLFWVPLKSNVDIRTKEEIERLNLPGIGFEEQAVRFYPEASLSSHVIGFVGKNNEGEDKGYFGLEGYYDRQLKGKAGTAAQVRDALGRPILAKINKNAGQIDGRSLVLNIDRAVQFMAERKLKEGIEDYQASGGMVGIIEPKTGNVLAMASYPSFDPVEYSQYDESLYKNPFISNLFEPGSTFKSLTMAAGLDAKAVKPDTKCPICSGPISIGGYEIKTWNNKYYKDIPMTNVIIRSDNTGMTYVGTKLGLEKMISYLKYFGIGELTNIDLQGEVPSILRPKEMWYQIDLATVSFGQGISVTPISLLTAFASLANEGKRMEPHVVSKIETKAGQIIPIEKKVVARPVSASTAKVMTEMLVNAVDRGEAKWTKVKGYRIAGKTGTAQIPIAGHYDPNKTIASFIGFAPADNPKFAMLVIIDRPTTSIYGSETAAPIFFSIARDLFTYYNIPPTE